MPVARLITAKSISYVDRIIASGASKDVYFSEDGLSVVEFYRELGVQNDSVYRGRLKAILAQFNLTLPRSEGGAAKDAEEAARMKALFCWPTGVAVAPRLGYVAPVFPHRYWFHSDPRNLPVKDINWEKVEKKAAWFTLKRVWRTLAKRERGDFRSLLQICLLLSHGVARLHMMGLAHSDLSSNNILVDPSPTNGNLDWPGCLIIDLDTLVVPGFFPPAVMGTKGYIAPEVLATSRLSDKERKMPNKATDRHALAVLIYELLFNRHPLDGPKMRSSESEEEDEFLAFGRDAVFIESPTDTSNRPKNLNISHNCLGRRLSELFEKTFVAGLRDPESRPLAAEWESALWHTLDLLHPCSNTSCLWRWFIYEDGRQSSCPWCGSLAPQSAPTFELLTQRSTASKRAGYVVCWPGRQLHNWHFAEDAPAVPGNNHPLADLITDTQGRWFIRNLRSDGMKVISPHQKPIPKGTEEPLVNGTTLLLTGQPSSRVGRFVQRIDNLIAVDASGGERGR